LRKQESLSLRLISTKFFREELRKGFFFIVVLKKIPLFLSGASLVIRPGKQSFVE
jgi:hypothetical protein